MILVLADTSIWVEHLRGGGDERLDGLLAQERVLMHPFVLGELALGNVRPSDPAFAFLRELQESAIADDDEVLNLIVEAELHGSRIGYVDAHLVAAVRLTLDAGLWTRDKQLHAVAERLSIAAPMLH